MAGSATMNTMVEGLMKIAKDLTGLMALPDADLEFLSDLQTRTLGYIQHSNMPQGAGFPHPSEMGGGSPMAAPPPPPGMPPDIAALMGGGGQVQGITPQSIPGGGVPGISSMPAPPNPDELRRILSP